MKSAAASPSASLKTDNVDTLRQKVITTLYTGDEVEITKLQLFLQNTKLTPRMSLVRTSCSIIKSYPPGVSQHKTRSNTQKKMEEKK